jgi:hypothetical protein
MFLAKTICSGKIKSLFEILFSNVSTVKLSISKNGIYSENETNKKNLIIVDLPAEGFDEYVFIFAEPIHIGLDTHVNTFFKSLKNKSTLTMSIANIDNLTINFEVKSLTDDCVIYNSETVVSEQSTKELEIINYDCEGISISCTNFSCMCKSFKSQFINVTKQNGQLMFSFEISGISERMSRYGKRVDEDVSLFHKTYSADVFSRINKLASFANEDIKIYAEQSNTSTIGKPLMIQAKCLIGTIKIIINEHIENA